MFRPVLIFTIILSLFAAGCGSQKEASAAANVTPRIIPVAQASASVRNVPAGFEETGTFVADETSDIGAQVAGKVSATPVDVGAFVKQGQVICELDHRDAQLRVEQAKAQLQQATAGVAQAQSRIGFSGTGKFDPAQLPEAVAANAAYESAQAVARQAAADAKRYQNLVATGDVSRSAYEKARTQQETAEAQANAARQQYEAALNQSRQSWGAVENSQANLEAVRSQLAQAEKALADTSIRAPFDGFVTARPAAVGEYLAVGAKVATVVRMMTLKLELQTPEQRASRLKLGMAVEARVSAYPDRTFHGKVSAINPAVDPASRLFIVEARFDNSDSQLRPGMFATAKVLLPGGEDAVFVPRGAVQRDKTTDSYQVYVIDKGAARLRVVAPGEASGDAIRIDSGLTGNETVAVSSLSQLYDGAPVQAR
jgi:multidrug efflux pump subunit AcrA (membrane-fusion protein)